MSATGNGGSTPLLLERNLATNDGRNYASLLLSRIVPGYTPQYVKQGSGGSVGKAVGQTIKTVAPIAAAFIPGVGPLAAAGIAAGGRAAGGALAGERFDLGGTLKAGALGAGGSLLRGAAGGLLRGPAQGAGGAAGPGFGEALKSIGAELVPGGGGAGGGGFLGGVGRVAGRLGGGVLDFIKADPERAIRLGLGGVGAFQAARQQGRANELTNRALGPLFDANAVNPFASLPVDEGNPYARRIAPRRGQAALRAELAR